MNDFMAEKALKLVNYYSSEVSIDYKTFRRKGMSHFID